MYTSIMPNKYVFTSVPDKKELEDNYANGLTQTEVGQLYGVSQKVIYSWFKKLGIESRVAAKRDQRGEKNHMWKGDDAGYASLHRRVEVQRGKPSVCETCGTTTARMYNWANLTGKYHDIFDYKRLCRSCHAKLDRHGRWNEKQKRIGGKYAGF